MLGNALNGQPELSPVGVVGLGVVGGTVAACFREAGVPVAGYDPVLGVGRLEDLSPCRVVFCCVPTPSTEDGGYDDSILWSAVRDIELLVADGTVLVVKSTVPPGTNDRLSAAFPRVEFASIPEFLVAANPTETFTRPDRVVIGARSGETARRLSELMRVVARTAPVLVVRPLEAELVKLCANAMLAAKVTIANELADVCTRFGVEWDRVQPGVGLDRRIGHDHMTVTSERGFGGMCLPKDLDGLIVAARDAGHAPRLLEEIAQFNRRVRDEARARLDDRAEPAAGIAHG